MRNVIQRRWSAGIVGAALIGLGLAQHGAALAQGPGLVQLADEPVKIEAAGMTVRVPAGATVSSQFVDSATSVQVTGPGAKWVMTIAAPKTGDLNATVAQASEKALKDIMFSDVLKDPRSGETLASRGEILDRVTQLRIPGSAATGERFYVAMPRTDGTRLVRGVTFFKPLPDRFVKFELAVAETEFPAARAAYELSIASASFSDPKAMQDNRRDMIRTGVDLIARLTSEDIAAAMKPASNEASDGGRAWFRFYKPGVSGQANDAEERGFRSLRFFKGTRAEIDPRAAGTKATPDNPEGILAEVNARLLNRSAMNGMETIDVEAYYFMTTDRHQEAWSVRTAVRNEKSGQATVYTETGTRSGKTMTVIVSTPGSPNKTLRPTVPPEGYLNQVESFLLPRLMIGTGFEGEAGFYAYQSATESISLRRDACRKNPNVEGTWVIESRLRETGEPQRYAYNERGLLLQGEPAEQMITESIGLGELIKLWESKGLPVGSMKSKGR